LDARAERNAGHKERQYILKDAKTPAEKALRVARRQWQQITHGKRIEKLAAENLEKIASDSVAMSKRVATLFRRRETTELKETYRRELTAPEVRKFEKFKRIRRERHISEATGKEVGGALKREDYEWTRKIAKQFKDLDPDFLQYVPDYPTKKRSRRGKRDPKGRSVLDMRRGTRTTKPSRKAA
jgi:hypothetical protein